MIVDFDVKTDPNTDLILSQMREIQSGKSPEEVGKPPMERIVDVLAAEQARRWKEMTGEPIRGTLNTFPTPFRPQREPKRTVR